MYVLLRWVTNLCFYGIISLRTGAEQNGPNHLSCTTRIITVEFRQIYNSFCSLHYFDAKSITSSVLVSTKKYIEAAR